MRKKVNTKKIKLTGKGMSFDIDFIAKEGEEIITIIDVGQPYHQIRNKKQLCKSNNTL